MYKVCVVSLVLVAACGDDDLLVDAGTSDGSVTRDTAADPDALCVPTEARSENVTIAGGVGTLGGTLELPAGCPPFAVVVIISGTGTNDRDGNADGFGANQYAMLAVELQGAGIASLRFDDHGIGESTGAAPPIEEFRFDLEVEDAARWVDLVRDDARFDQVMLAGHSQGSLTAMLASQSAPVDGIISLAGTSLPGGRLLLEQAEGHISASDYAALENAVDELEAGRTVEELPASIRDVIPLFLQPYLIVVSFRSARTSSPRGRARLGAAWRR